MTYRNRIGPACLGNSVKVAAAEIISAPSVGDELIDAVDDSAIYFVQQPLAFAGCRIAAHDAPLSRGQD